MSENSSEFIVVYVTAPTDEIARRVASAVVNARLAACAKIIPDVISIYRWKGAVEESMECQLVIKTRRECFESLSEMVEKIHPYEVPEIVAVPASMGSAPYLEWIYDMTAPD